MNEETTKVTKLVGEKHLENLVELINNTEEGFAFITVLTPLSENRYLLNITANSPITLAILRQWKPGND